MGLQRHMIGVGLFVTLLAGTLLSSAQAPEGRGSQPAPQTAGRGREGRGAGPVERVVADA